MSLTKRFVPPCKRFQLLRQSRAIQCRILQEEHDPANANSTKKEFMELVQRMCVDCIPSLLLHVDAFCFALSLEARYRGCVAVDTYCRRTDGTRIHNVRKNVHTST